MQKEGITNPTETVKQFTKDFVIKLSKMPMSEEVKIEGKSFINSNGEIIATLPFEID